MALKLTLFIINAKVGVAIVSHTGAEIFVWELLANFPSNATFILHTWEVCSSLVDCVCVTNALLDDWCR